MVSRSTLTWFFHGFDVDLRKFRVDNCACFCARILVFFTLLIFFTKPYVLILTAMSTKTATLLHCTTHVPKTQHNARTENAAFIHLWFMVWCESAVLKLWGKSCPNWSENCMFILAPILNLYTLSQHECVRIRAYRVKHFFGDDRYTDCPFFRAPKSISANISRTRNWCLKKCVWFNNP